MAEATLKEKTAKGLFWGGISNFVQQIVGAVFGIFIARIVSPDDYGLIGMLAIFTAIGSSIMESGFTIALANKKEIKHEDYNAVFWFSLTAGVLIYIILFFSAPLIARFFNSPELIGLSRLLFLSLLIGGAGTALHAIMYKKLMVKERAKIDIVAVFVSGAVGLVLALKGFAYWGLAIQQVTMTSVSVLLRWYYAPWKPTLHINFAPIKEMFGFSSKLLLTQIFIQINNNLFSVILGKFYNPEQVGYYYQGNKWTMYGSFTIGGMINSVAQPVFVESMDDKGRVLMIFRKMLRFGAFVSFPAILGLAFIGNEFIFIALGEKWLASVPYLQLLCLWGSTSYIMTLYTFLLMSYGKSTIFLYGNIVICVLQLASVALTFPFGIYPMVIAYISCNFSGLLIWHFFANKLIHISLWQVLKDVLPYVVITIGCFSVAWVMTRGIENIYLLFILKVAISALLYILIMKYSRSTIFRESIAFLTKRKTTKT